MGLALKDDQKYTYADYLKWSDDVRYELIEGRAYCMSPAPLLAHQNVAGEIYRQVANRLLGKKCRVFIAPVDVRLPELDQTDESIGTIVQPDVFVVCDPDKLTRRGIRARQTGLWRCYRPPLRVMIKSSNDNCMNATA